MARALKAAIAVVAAVVLSLTYLATADMHTAKGRRNAPCSRAGPPLFDGMRAAEFDTRQCFIAEGRDQPFNDATRPAA